MSKKSPTIFQDPGSSDPESSGKKGPPRGCLALFGLPFLCAGLFVLWSGFLHPLIVAADIRLNWKETPCRILGGEIAGTKKDDVKPLVTYAYTYQDKHYTGTAITPASAMKESGRDHAKAVLARHPVGQSETCRVNPANPGDAVLENGVSGSTLMLLPFGGVFACVGGGLMLYGLGVIGKNKAAPGDLGPASGTRKPLRLGRTGVTLIGLVFLGAGLGIMYGIGIRPAWKAHCAGSWEKTPCRIVSSEVGSHSGDKGTTYSVDIEYDYVFQGKTYHGDRYDFLGGSSSGYDDKRDTVRAYPVGSLRECLVNPENPDDSVISRKLGWVVWFFGFGFSGVFAVAGTAVCYAGLTGKMNAYGERDNVVRDAGGGLRLKPEYGPVGKLVFFAFFTAFWNGITSVFVTQAVKSFAPGRSREWGLSVFMIPFVAVGLVMLGATIRAFVALFSPRLDITLAEPAHAGKTLRLRWSARGDAGKIREVTLALEGFSRPGSGSESGPKKFAVIPLKTVADILAGHGSATLDLPADMTPTGEKTLWKIAVRAKIARGVNIATDHPVEILPPANPFA